MLLVQLTALVVWIAQYVSAAELDILQSLYPGDALVFKTSLIDGANSATNFYHVGPAVEPGVEFKSEPDYKFCPLKPFKSVVSATQNWLNVIEWHYFVKSEADELIYYIDQDEVKIPPVIDCSDEVVTFFRNPNVVRDSNKQMPPANLYCIDSSTSKIKVKPDILATSEESVRTIEIVKPSSKPESGLMTMQLKLKDMMFKSYLYFQPNYRLIDSQIPAYDLASKNLRILLYSFAHDSKADSKPIETIVDLEHYLVDKDTVSEQIVFMQPVYLTYSSLKKVVEGLVIASFGYNISAPTVRV